MGGSESALCPSFFSLRNHPEQGERRSRAQEEPELLGAKLVSVQLFVSASQQLTEGRRSGVQQHPNR